MTGGTGASSGTGASRRGGNKAAVTVHGATHGEPRPLHRPSRRVARPSLSLPTRERTCSRRLGEPRAPTSLPFPGENKRGLPLHRGEQEGSCGAVGLRFPHRSIDPRGEEERRFPAGPAQSFRKAGTQERQNRRGPMIRRPRWGRSRCLSEYRWVRRFPFPFRPVKKGDPLGVVPG